MRNCIQLYDTYTSCHNVSTVFSHLYFIFAIFILKSYHIMTTLYLIQHKVDKIGKLFDPNFEIDDFLTIKKVVISCQLFFTLSSHT